MHLHDFEVLICILKDFYATTVYFLLILDLQNPARNLDSMIGLSAKTF